MRAFVFLALVLITQAGCRPNAVRAFEEAGQMARVEGALARTTKITATAERLAISEAAVSRASMGELKAYDAAVSEYELTSLEARLMSGRLDEAAAYVRHNGYQGGTVKLTDDLPFIRVKLTGQKGFDADVLKFAQTRFKEAVAQPFDPKSLKVVNFGMSDDLPRSLVESAKFQRSLPLSVWDDVGPLAHLDEWGSLSHVEKVSLMSRYSDHTLIAVGHVDEATGSFFIFRNGRKVTIDIAAWSDAAAEAGVNFVPIGCNSAQFSRIGAQGLINSDIVLHRIRNVVSSDATTMAGFLRELSGPDLVMVADPFEVRLFSSGVSIVRKTDGKALGKVIFRGAGRYVETRTEAAAEGRLYAPCFASKSFKAFMECDAQVRATMESVPEVKAAVVDLINRDDRLKDAESQLQTLYGHREKLARRLSSRERITAPLMMVLLIVLAQLQLGSRAIEQEHGFQLRRVLGWKAAARSIHIIRNGLLYPNELLWLVLTTAGAAVAYAIALWAPKDDWFGWIFGGALATTFLWLLLWHHGREQNSVSLRLMAPLMLCISLTCAVVTKTTGDIGMLVPDIASQANERADLLDGEMNAAWRDNAAWRTDGWSSEDPENLRKPSLPPPIELPRTEDRA